MISQEEARRRLEAEEVARRDLVRRLGDSASWVVRTNYEYAVADVSGPFNWTPEQVDAVRVAYSPDTMTRGYPLKYEDRWQVMNGQELREWVGGTGHQHVADGVLDDYLLKMVGVRHDEEVELNAEGVYVVFEGSDIEAAFPATEEGWAAALAYRDDTLAKYDADALAAAGVTDE